MTDPLDPPSSQPPPPSASEATNLAPPTTPPLQGPLTGLVSWSPIDILLGIAILLGFGVVGLTAVVAFTGDTGLDAVIASQVVQSVSFVAAALLIAARGTTVSHAWKALGVSRPVSPWVTTAALTLLGYLAFAFVLVTFIAKPEQVDLADELGFDQSTLGAISAAILIVGVAPFVEEVFFRGFVFAGLRTRMSLPWAAVLSGALFGSVHLTAGNAVVAFQLAVLGGLLAWLYERTGTLWAPILVHGVNNALAFVVLVTT